LTLFSRLSLCRPTWSCWFVLVHTNPVFHWILSGQCSFNVSLAEHHFVRNLLSHTLICTCSTSEGCSLAAAAWVRASSAFLLAFPGENYSMEWWNFSWNSMKLLFFMKNKNPSNVHEISWNFIKVNFVKFHEKFHERFNNISWNFMKFSFDRVVLAE
jgi:hypothetical protein